MKKISHQQRNKTRNACILPAAALLLAVSQPAAAESIWSGVSGGSGGVALWGSPTNWAGNALPAAGDGVRFGTGFNSGATVNATGRRIVSTVLIDTTLNFTLANFGGVGDSIVLTNGSLDRTTASSGTQTISSEITIADNDFWNINGGGRLNITGSIHGDGSIGFDRSGNGILALSGVDNDVAFFHLNGGATRVNGGTLTIRHPVGADSMRVGEMAAMYVENGAVVNAIDQGSGGDAVVATTNTNGVIYVQGAGSRLNLPANLRLGDNGGTNSATAGTAFVETGAAMNVAGAIQLGNRNGDYGLLRVASGGSLTAHAVEAGVRPGGSANFVITGNGSAGTLNFLTLGGSSPSVNGGTGDMVVANDGALTIKSEFYFYNSGGAAIVSNGRLNVASLRHASGIKPVIRIADPLGGGTALTVGIDNSSSTFAGSITDEGGVPGSLAKVGNGTLTLTGTLSFSGRTEVGVGTLVLPNGLPLPGGTLSVGGALYAAGTINRAASIGGVLNPTDTLSIGDATSPGGFYLAEGTLNVGGNRVTLAASGDAIVDGVVTMSDGGRLGSTAGMLNGERINVAAGANATIAGKFSNFGTVNGPTSTSKSLTFSGIIDGFGTFTGNATLAGESNLGFTGPSNVPFEKLTLSDNSVVRCDVLKLGDTKFEDRITATAVTLDGELNARYNLNHPEDAPPAQGDVWTIISAGSITGKFDETTGRRINATTWLATIYGPTSVQLAVALPGDANLDGIVNISDFALLAGNFNVTGVDWTAGDFSGDGKVGIEDFAALASRFNQQIPADLPRGGSVPEPTVLSIGAAGILLRRTRRNWN